MSQVETGMTTRIAILSVAIVLVVYICCDVFNYQTTSQTVVDQQRVELALIEAKKPIQTGGYIYTWNNNGWVQTYTLITNMETSVK